MAGVNDQAVAAGHVVPAVTSKWAKGSGGPSGDETQNLVTDDHYYVEDIEDGTLTSSTGRIDRHPLLATKEVAAPLSHGSNPNSNMAGRRREDDENLVAYAVEPESGQGADLKAREIEVSPALTRIDGRQHERGARVATATTVRRLMPVECERLQSLPDGWTAFGPDSVRYAAIGDAVTANVAEWIGRRILDEEGS